MRGLDMMTEVSTLPALASPEAMPDLGAIHDDAKDTSSALAAHETTMATANSDPNSKVTKKIVKKKRRPARPQVDPSTVKTGELPPQTGTVFNIWYNKWSGGDREDKYLSKHHAEGRCNIARDSGYTRADKVPGSYFCLFFARGLCPKGHECEYLHRLPTIHDLFNPNVDCFGRDKHSDYRDDMGGVGSFMRQNRTLYVGRIHVSDDIEEIVARHFTEWGQIDRTRVLSARGVAFVTYTNEANSQFAKEAMAHQSLDHNEILNVRWATVDPNPMAQAREVRKIEEQAAEAIRRALPAEYVAEIEGKDPEARKRKRIEGGFGLDGYEAPDEVYFARASAKRLNPAADSTTTTTTITSTTTTTGQDDDQAIQYNSHEEPSASQHGAQNGVPATTGILGGSTLAALQAYSVRAEVGAGASRTDFQSRHQARVGDSSSGSGGGVGNSSGGLQTGAGNALVSYGSDSDEE